MKLTRRTLATVMLNSAAALALEQTPSTAVPTADEDLKAARDRLKGTGELLTRLSVPMETEPAVTFKA